MSLEQEEPKVKKSVTEELIVGSVLVLLFLCFLFGAFGFFLWIPFVLLIILGGE